MPTLRCSALALAAGFCLAVAPPSALAAPKAGDADEHVQLLAINDFHGNLEPPTGSSGRIPVSRTQNVDAGGVEYLSTHVQQLRSEPGHDASFFVGAGDLIGASPLLSGLFHDEPAIESLNLIGMDFSSVGNHEFDEGLPELLRMQNGGCHPTDGCQDGDGFAGAYFRYLAANVFFAGSDRNPLPPYKVVKVGNAKLAFIGLTLEQTPDIVTPSGVAGLEFRDEAQTVNALVRRLRAEQGVRSFVVLIHQGAGQNPLVKGYQDVDSCDGINGDILPIAEALDPQVDVIVSGHTHQAYICNYAGKLLTSASSFGRLVTDIELRIDHRSKDVTAATADNVIVTRTVPKDERETALIAKYKTLAGPIAGKVIGRITADITKAQNAAGESALGDVIADAQLAATSPSDFGGAVVAFMNPGGIRGDLVYGNQDAAEQPGELTYNELYTVQPFANTMVVKSFTGDQIKALLEQQFQVGRTLQVSEGFTYAWSAAAPVGSKVSDIRIGGVPVEPARSYRVAMNNFLASGGDGFTVFRDGTGQLGGAVDIDALANFIAKRSPVAPGPQDRITKLP